jgi:S-(hydroxymethyl)glutathione dehydrogenase / alcohol dehydrogenase
MKAAVLYESPGKLHVEEVSVAAPVGQEVLIHVGATGLCHSDLHLLEHANPLDGPTVLGHEGAGIVEAIGPDVDYVKVGDHVIAYPVARCGNCYWCHSGHPTQCTQIGMVRPGRLHLSDGRPLTQFIGLATFAEQMLVHQNKLVKIESDIPPAVAALVGCGVPTGVGAVLNKAQVMPGSTVAVIGCGGIGLNAIQGAVLAEASRIVGIDINDGKLQLARQFGATDVINNSAGDAVEQLHDMLPRGEGVDYSFEAIGSKATFELAFDVLGPLGTATVIGVLNGDFELPGRFMLAGERRIQGSRMGSGNFREDLPYYLRLYREGRLKLDELVSNRIPLSEINEGYAAIRDGSIARSVVIFDS